MLALRISITDEGVWIARLANKAPGNVAPIVRYSTLTAWSSSAENEVFGLDIAEELRRAIDFIVT